MLSLQTLNFIFSYYHHTMTVVQAGPKLVGIGKSRAFRCIWVLEELRIPYWYIPAMPQSKEAKQYNTLGKIPILVEEDGISLYETNAIINYLGDKDWDSGSS